MNAVCLFVSFLLIGGIQPYSERGSADFDDFFTALESNGIWRPYGKGEYVFIANPPMLPYHSGQWLYTDFGWTWQGNHPTSWATEHYGNWIFDKKSKTCLWKPGDKWYPAIAEWKSSGKYIGWRACAFDAYGNPIAENQDSLDPVEWNFVLKEKLKTPLKPEDFATPTEVEKLLKKSAPATHTFKAWRNITRTGPDPFTIWEEKDNPLPKRTIRSLPAPNVTPADGGPEDAFFYRPKFHQDLDGIFHRIEILLKRSKEDQNVTAISPNDPRKKVLEALTNLPAEEEKPSDEKPPEKSILFQETPVKQK